MLRNRMSTHDTNLPSLGQMIWSRRVIDHAMALIDSRPGGAKCKAVSSIARLDLVFMISSGRLATRPGLIANLEL